jgi:hypothetical protein
MQLRSHHVTIVAPTRDSLALFTKNSVKTSLGIPRDRWPLAARGDHCTIVHVGDGDDEGPHHLGVLHVRAVVNAAAGDIEPDG